MEAYKSRETTLRDYLRVIFRRKAIIITAVVVVMATVIISQEIETPLYLASVKMMVEGNKKTDVDIYRKMSFGRKSIVTSYAEMVKSRTVLERAVRALRLDQRPLDYEKEFSSKLKALLIDRRVRKIKQELEEMTPEERRDFLFDMAMRNLETNVRVRVPADVSIFHINVADYNPRMAVMIANVVSRSYVIFDLEQQVAELQLKYGEKHTTVVLLKKYIKELLDRLDGKPLPDIEAMGPASVKIIEQARKATPVVTPDTFVLLISFFMSLFFGVMLVFIIDYLDQSFKSPHDVERFLNVPVIGSIPANKWKDSRLITEINPLDPEDVRPFQKLSSRIYLMCREKKLKSLLITDAEGSAEDTAAVIANLGICMARNANHKVIIVDAGLKTPYLSKLFKVSGNQGMSDVLAGKLSLDEAIRDAGHNLYVLPSGKTLPLPDNILESRVMGAVMQTLREKYDIILLACADLKNFTDGVLLSAFADGVILVVNEGKTNRQVVRWAVEPLEEKKANIVGAILNNRRYVIPKMIYRLT